MIIEMRSYRMKPGSIPEVENRFAEGLRERTKVSPLGAFFHTEVGPLNRIIHCWPYDDLAHRSKIRSQSIPGWPPKIQEFIENMESKIINLAPFSANLKEPRRLGCGLYEIRLPAMQPGSSIMPGKVNPVVPEVVNQICFQIIGNDVTVSMASEASELELNMAEPIIAFNLFFGLTLLRNAAIVLASRCIAGIEPNRERCREYVQNSIGLVTALNPVLGYEKSAAIAKEALKTGGSVYDLVIAKGWLTKEKLDELLKPENMTHPRLNR